MGRLYELIRKDVEKLHSIDEAIRNNQTVSMDEVFNVAIALEKIQYVIVYAESERPDLFEGEGRFPLGDMDHFNLPENFENVVNVWEDGLTEEQINHAVAHLEKQTEAEAYVPEIMPHNAREYYDYVRGTVDRIASVSQRGHFGISRDGVVAMAVSAQQDLVKNVFAQDYAFDPNVHENQEVLEFIDNPIEETVNSNSTNLEINGTQETNEFLRSHKKYYQDVLAKSDHPRPFNEVGDYASVANALAPIHQAKWNPKDLSAAIENSVRTYAENYKGKRNEMNIGSFISLVRDRIESTIFDHAMILGNDPDSKFLKDFLQNPIQTLEQRYRDRANEDIQKQVGNNNLVAERIHGEVEHYNQARVGKVDRFAQIEVSKKSRFDSYFAEQNPNFNPATFKHTYQGSAFERFLGRTSKEWTDLADHIDSWNNAGTERDFDKATDLAGKYLRHKFPNLDPKDVTPEMCRGLRGAGKERGLFCLSLVQGKAMAEDEVNQEIYEQANRRFDEMERRLHRGENFQDKLAGDLEQDNEIGNSQKDNEIVNENVIENNDINI
ncbi:MAG: hypothetical protein SPL80_05575 [Bacilli bacterium]|nr:hypothetical protein [Bacilli bacterium]